MEKKNKLEWILDATMRYLIICNDRTSFRTDWYDYENCYGEYIFCVVDLATDKIAFDGKTWKDIEEDHL